MHVCVAILALAQYYVEIDRRRCRQFYGFRSVDPGRLGVLTTPENI